MRASDAAVMGADRVHWEQLQWKPQTLCSFFVRFARDFRGLWEVMSASSLFPCRKSSDGVLLNVCDAYLLSSSNGSDRMDMLRQGIRVEVVVRIRPAIVVESRD